jgi:hypothetical protein
MHAASVKDSQPGWRLGAVLSIIAVGVALIVNTSFMIYGVTQSPANETDYSTKILLQGNCTKVKLLNTWLHLGVNVTGTILLAASNFTQQCLVAPTRDEINAAHSRRDWMDIGIHSVRNLTRISWKRTVVWIVLGVTSIPLHLL